MHQEEKTNKLLELEHSWFEFQYQLHKDILSLIASSAFIVLLTGILSVGINDTQNDWTNSTTLSVLFLLLFGSSIFWIIQAISRIRQVGDTRSELIKKRINILNAKDDTDLESKNDDMKKFLQDKDEKLTSEYSKSINSLIGTMYLFFVFMLSVFLKINIIISIIAVLILAIYGYPNFENITIKIVHYIKWIKSFLDNKNILNFIITIWLITIFIFLFKDNSKNFDLYKNHFNPIYNFVTNEINSHISFSK